MAYVDIVTALALLQFMAFGLQVGAHEASTACRRRPWPATRFSSAIFAFSKTRLEQLIVFLPGLYLFSALFQPPVGRGPRADLPHRPADLFVDLCQRTRQAQNAGFGLTFLPMIVLIIGGSNRRGDTSDEILTRRRGITGAVR